MYWTRLPRVPARRNAARSAVDRPKALPCLKEVWQLPGGLGEDGIESPREARRLIAETCRRWNVPRALVQDLTLIVSELVTNAVLHAPGETLMVGLALTPDAVWVFCVDQGPRAPMEPRPGDDEHGRGLLLVSVLASRYTVTPCGPGTAVAACITLPACTAPHVHTPEGTFAAAPAEESPDAPHSDI